MIRLLIVDDHTPSREKAVADLSSGDLIEIVGQAETSDEAFKFAKALLPDIVLLDLHLPGLMGMADLFKRLVALANVRVVVFASPGKASEVQDLLDAGAAAYVLKEDAGALLRMSILMVYRGSKNVISPALPPHLLKLVLQERNILREIGKRGGIAKAAERCGLTEYDLNQILYHTAEKLEVESIDKLVRWAKKHGF